MAEPTTLPAKLLHQPCVWAAGLQERLREGDITPALFWPKAQECGRRVLWLCPEGSWFCFKDSSGLTLKASIASQSFPATLGDVLFFLHIQNFKVYFYKNLNPQGTLCVFKCLAYKN